MLFNVVLERHPEVGLGLAIKGGNPGEWEGCGAHIVDILPGGPAFGKLRPGDVVIAINGISLEQKTYSEILATLREVDNFATLLVYRRDEEPETGTSSQSLFLPETPVDMKRDCRDPPMHLNAFSPRRTTSMPGFSDVDDPNSWAARRTHASFPVLPCEGTHDAFGSFYCNAGSAASETSEQRRRRANLLKVNLAKKRASEALGVELSGQLIITSIASGGKAERSGLRVGDRVVNLNGIDAAHLSLIDAAYILRRQQSDVTLMRVEHEDGEETLARLYNTESPTRVYENLREPAPPLYHHQHQHHTCCCHTHLAQGRQSVECVHTPMPVGHPRERPPASHTCIISPCVEESEFEERGIIGRCPKLSAADAVHGTQCHSGQTRVVTWIGDRADPIDSFASQPGRFARLTDEVDSSTPVGPFLAHGRTPDGTIPMTAGSTTAATVAMTDSMAEGKHRVVNVTRHPLLGTGIRLIGGNAVGLFISDVNPQSSAAAAGIVPGDEILAINDEKVNDMTKADAALRILGTPVALKLELKRNTTKYFNFLDELLGPGDDFYVRAAFSLSPLTDLASYGADEQVPALPITCGDIFHVTDSLYNGSFSSWLAQRVSPNTSRLGRIPSSEKALKLLRDPLQSSSMATIDLNRDLRSKQSLVDVSRNAQLSQTFAEAPDPIPANPYLRVVKMERFPLPRPIVLYGPLANRARQLLVEASVSEGTEDGSLGERLQFELPPISGKPFEAGGWTEMSAGVIRMSAIQAVMERGNHPLVDLRPSSVEGLIQNGLPPIVLLFTASSIEQIKLILDKQQQQQQSSEDSTVNGRRWKYTKEKSRQLWAEAISLRQTIPHLITDCVPLINSFQEGELDETEWLNNLLSVIRYQQSQPIWVAEGSFVLRKQNATAPMEQQAEPLVLQETDFNSSPKSDTGSRRDAKQSLIWPYKEDSGTQDEAIADWNALEKVKLSALAVNPDVQLTYIESIRPSLLVDTRPTHPQRRGITVDEISQTEPISSFVDGKSDKALMTFPIVPELPIKDDQDDDSDKSTVKGEEGELHGEEDRGDSWFVFDDFPRSYGISRKPLSARNMPCGIISEPRAVVAETSGEFDHIGGKLIIPEHGVMLEVPAGALPEMQTKQTLYLRVYDGKEGACGSDTASESGKPHIVSPLVMCGPKGLQFLKPVVLTLPRFHTHRRDRRGEEIRCWALSVMHAATLTDANSSSENETVPQATRNWHEARPTAPWLAGDRNITTFRDTDIDSDSSAGVTCQIADSVISLLIYHF